ncbi:Beta-glucuronidase [Blattella germanica]|nr:Beta-glucuronidase [Blattella germanica]
MWKKGVTYVSLVLLIAVLSAAEAGILYPFESESRNTHSLDGVWNFRLASTVDSQVGHREYWYKKPLKESGSTIPMPVPSSYNDITQDKSIRDHVGVVWYDRDFYVPIQWTYDNLKVWLRFGSVNYQADVYVNGELVISHSGGHVPFQTDVTSVLNFGGRNLISVAVNNTLTDITVPQGTVSKLTTDDGTKLVQRYPFDYFHYAGIHRPVLLHTTPATFIDDISVLTDINGDTETETTVLVNLLDKDGSYVLQNVSGTSGTLEVPHAKLWWPYLMDPAPGYMYTLEVVTENPKDVYRLPVGIRKMQWNNNTMTINGKPIYIRGFGRHEDSNFRGKGHDFPLIARDYNLIKWVGANTYHTSHYPYSEEIMDFADKEGIMIIVECPGINIGAVAEHIKTLDPTRPITMALNTSPESDKTAQYLDVIGFNRYNAWYANGGYTETIKVKVKDEAARWRKKFNKPVFMREYGADSMVGLHLSPDFIWSEEYQVTVLSRHFQAFDELRQEEYFIGEMIWNFADFITVQSYTRVGGNKKGIFTRERQPKASAHFTRKRYWALAQELDNATPPEDLNDYVSVNSWTQLRNEL